MGTAAGYAGRPDIGADWIEKNKLLADALRQGEISPLEWQNGVERLAGRVGSDELIALLERSDRRPRGRGLPSYPLKHSIRFRDVDASVQKLRYAVAVFEFDEGNVITPHAHRNMVSAHTVLNGSFRVRTYDTVRRDGDALVIRPASDETVGEGAVSTMSRNRNNVHWFVPLTDKARTLDVIVAGLRQGEPAYQIKAVDPMRGKRLDGGLIRASYMSFEDGARIYSPDV